MASKKRRELVDEVTAHGMRRLSTAAVLFHHALAERMGLGPTDLQCYNLLRERGAMSGTDLATLTGLTTGAISGTAARLEHAGFLRRAADPVDGRKQVLSPLARRDHEIHALFRRLHDQLAAALDGYDSQELSTVVDFLSRTTALLSRQIAELRMEPVMFVPMTERRSPRPV